MPTKEINIGKKFQLPQGENSKNKDLVIWRFAGQSWQCSSRWPAECRARALSVWKYMLALLCVWQLNAKPSGHGIPVGGMPPLQSWLNILPSNLENKLRNGMLKTQREVRWRNKQNDRSDCTAIGENWTLVKIIIQSTETKVYFYEFAPIFWLCCWVDVGSRAGCVADREAASSVSQSAGWYIARLVHRTAPPPQ